MIKGVDRGRMRARASTRVIKVAIGESKDQFRTTELAHHWIDWGHPGVCFNAVCSLVSIPLYV